MTRPLPSTGPARPSPREQVAGLIASLTLRELCWLRRHLPKALTLGEVLEAARSFHECPAQGAGQ